MGALRNLMSESGERLTDENGIALRDIPAGTVMIADFADVMDAYRRAPIDNQCGRVSRDGGVCRLRADHITGHRYSQF